MLFRSTPGIACPGKGYNHETKSPNPVKSANATSMWNDFLGAEPYTNIHPRTGLPDPNRLVSQDGSRSVRFGKHEMYGNPNKYHFHLEVWTYDPVNDVLNVDQLSVHVQ